MDISTKNLELEPFVANEFGDRYLESVNQAAFRQVGYEEYLREHFGSPPFQEGKLYVIIGTDSGLLINYLRKTGLPPRSNFLLVELPEVLARLDAELILAELGQRLVVTTGVRMAEALGTLRFPDYSRLNQVVILKSFGAMDGHLPSYAELHATVRKELQAVGWLVKGQLSHQLFMKLRLVNLGENRLPVTCLEGRFQGKTAIVLGGGPSLDEVLPWLQENRRNLVVLAAARISGRLRSVGIVPDFVLTVDPNPGSFDNSREALSFWREAVLIHSEFTVPALLGQWRGRSFYGGKRIDWDTPLNGNQGLISGVTVTNFAVDTGIALGFRRILLAGVDFCYSQSGVTHAQGSREHTSGAVIGKNLTVETNAGGFSETSEDFVVARNQMGLSARGAQARGCEIINLSLGAARIGGVSYVQPEQINFLPGEHNSASEVIGALPAEDRAARKAHYETMLAELARARKSLTRINELFKKAEVWKAKDRLAVVEKALNKEQQNFFQTVTKFGSGRFMLAYATVDLENMTEGECDRASKLFFSAFADSVGELLPFLEGVEQRLRLRLQEEQESPDFAALAAQWRADDQPGRILLWEDRFPGLAAQLAGREGELAKALRDEFAEMLGKSFALAQPKEKTFKAEEIRATILALFKKQDRAGLERIGQALSAYQNQDGEIFASLARAQAAELAGADAQALGEYERIVAAGATLILEDALSRIVALAIKSSDMPAVLGALEHLSRLSPAYEPRYAEALAVVGEHERALEVYADYLDKYPTDIATMLRLGRYYQQLSHPDGARYIFGQVLELEPGNRTAAALLAGLS